MNTNPVQLRASRRVKALRELRGMKQEELASALGLEHRQTLAQIEQGDRAMTPEELIDAAKALGVQPQDLLDPFQLVGEGEFNFRTRNADPAVLDAFQAQSGRWIATYRELGLVMGEQEPVLTPTLPVRLYTRYEEVWTMAERLAERWELGDVPALKLERAIHDNLQTLVLYVDAPAGVSGAAIHLPGFQAILVNRGETEGRRNFDLAHELFHVLTWDHLRPRKVDPPDASRGKGIYARIERLADNFAAAILMPGWIINHRWEARNATELGQWAFHTARALRVSMQALGYRLLNLGLINKDELLQVQADVMVSELTSLPRLFSEYFVERIQGAIESGRLSVRRAAALLGLALPDLAALCAAYGRPLTYSFQA
jgi:transcriptional regulator with XRE-family HTH domain